jgi:sugar lactone lactonase YvrE
MITNQPQVVLSGLAFGESPRWHGGQLWVSDWGAGEVLTVDPSGASHVVARVGSFPMCIDFLRDGRLLIVDSAGGQLLRREPDGSLVRQADLSPLGPSPWNEVVADSRDNAYVNNIGFDFPASDPGPGFVALVTAEGNVSKVAEDLWFPNGMVLTPDGSTLLVAESYGHQITAFDVTADGGLANRRVWADLGDGTPDGICIDAEQSVWYADVPGQRCVRVREGGEVLQTVQLDRGCFSCALGGADRRTLFMIAMQWSGVEASGGPERTGAVLSVPVTVPGVG